MGTPEAEDLAAEAVVAAESAVINLLTRRNPVPKGTGFLIIRFSDS